MANGLCSACSDENTCTVVTCFLNKFNDDNNINNGCEVGCPTVAGGICDACSDKDTCIAVTCAANKFNDDGDATNGCEAGCVALSGGFCAACSSSAVADCASEQCSAGTSYSDASYKLKKAGNYCHNRVGSGGLELSFGPAADLQSCATHVQNEARCGSEFSYSAADKFCDCPSAEEGTCTEAELLGYSIYTLTFKTKLTGVVQLPPRPPVLHKEGFDCSSGDEWLGEGLSLQQCSDKCRAKDGCQFFIFGFAGKAGKCYHEKTTTAACEEGVEEDDYNFYENLDAEAFSECVTCPTGKYQGQDLAVKGVACEFCTEGKGFVTKDKTCTICAGGQYQAQNEAASVACALCSNGKYSNDGASQCLDCPEGYTAGGVGASACGLSAAAVTEKLAALTTPSDGADATPLTPAELQAASDLREGYLDSFLVSVNQSSSASDSGTVNIEKSKEALNTVNSLVAEPNQVSPAAAAAASSFVDNVLGSLGPSSGEDGSGDGATQEVPPEMLKKAGKIMDGLVAAMSLSGKSSDGAPAVKMSANQAADVGMSLAKSATSLSDMGATEVGGKPISEFKANLLTSFLGVVDTAKPEPTLVNATVKTKDVKVQQQLMNALPESAAGLDAKYDISKPEDATISPPKVEAIRAGLASSLNVDVAQIKITQLSTETTRRRDRRRMESSSTFHDDRAKIRRNLATTSLLIDFEVLVTVEVDESGDPKNDGFNAAELANLEEKLQLISEGKVTTVDRTGSTSSESGSGGSRGSESGGNSNRIAIPDLGLVVEAVADVAGVSDDAMPVDSVGAQPHVRDTSGNATIIEREIPCAQTLNGCPRPDEGVTNAAIATVGAIVGNPDQNSAAATGAAASFLADALDDLSSPAGGTGVDAAPVPAAVLNAATGAIANTLTSAFSTAGPSSGGGSGEAKPLDPAAKKAAARNMAKLSKAASGLALASLRGIAAGAPPVKLKAGGLSLTAARENSTSMFSGDNTSTTSYDDEKAEFVLPSLPPSLSSGDGPVDASMLVWDQSPWTYEAGAIGSNVAGLSLTFPDLKNKKANVENLDNEISIMISRIGGPAKNILSKDSCIYLDEKNVSKGGARFWSDRGCRVDKIETNATHIVCKCNHLTDFGSRLIGSLASSIDVVGQLGGSSEELLAKAAANMGTIFIMVGLLIFTCLLCAVGTYLEVIRKTTAKKFVLKLTCQVDYQTNIEGKKSVRALENILFAKSVKTLTTISVRDDKDSAEDEAHAREDSQRHVTDAMCRHFWADQPVSKLKAALRNSNTPIKARRRSSNLIDIAEREKMSLSPITPDEPNFWIDMADPDAAKSDDDEDDEDDVEKWNDQQSWVHRANESCCVQLSRRVCSEWKSGMTLTHEWLSPFTLTAETEHFTPAMRIILLVFVLLSEILCEALLYDLYNPDQAGTCSIVNVNLTKYNVTNTTNVTTSELYVDGVLQNDTSLLAAFKGTSPSSLEEPEEEEPTLVEFGAATVTETFLPPPPEAPPLEDILTGLTTALMVVPLATICVNALMKIADGNAHQAVWERYGIQDLNHENLMMRHSSVVRSALKKKATDGGEKEGNDSGKENGANEKEGDESSKEEDEGSKEHFDIALFHCGPSAFVSVNSVSPLAEKGASAQTNTIVPAGAKTFTLTNQTAAMLHKGSGGGRVSIRLFDPVQREFLVPCQNEAAARELLGEVRRIVFMLPQHEEGLNAAVCSAAGRYSFVVKFHNKYGGADRSAAKTTGCCARCACCSRRSKWRANYYVRNERDRQTCQYLEDLCETIVAQSEEQERVLGEIAEWKEEQAAAAARADEEERKRLEEEERKNQSCCRRVCCGLICGSILGCLAYCWAWVIWFRDFIVDMMGLADLWEWICCCLEKEEEEEEEEEEETYNFTEEQVLAFREVFKNFDADGSGYVETSELKSTMYAMGAVPSDAEVSAIMTQYDANNDGKLSFEEILVMLDAPRSDEDGELLNLFRYEAETFTEEIRQQLMPAYQIEKEKEEDEARDHLPCCCFTKVFDFLITGNRAELTDPHRGGRKWLIYTLMSLYMGITTFYIILFGFCHG